MPNLYKSAVPVTQFGIIYSDMKTISRTS